MARINIFGDFKVEQTKHLGLSGELMCHINRADVNLVNFEAPIRSMAKAIAKSGPNISQSVLSAEWLECRGFNAVSLANNHAMDYGEQGLNSTKEAFSSSVNLMGAGTWDEAYRLNVMTTKDGMKIGILCVTHCEFGTLTEHSHDAVGAAWCMHPEVLKSISGGAILVDFLLVYQHGGIEYMDQPLPEWCEQYKLWVDLGADAVIASHPHVPQGWELYKGKPICYSLGNFCFQGFCDAAPHWNDSLCVTLDIQKPHTADLSVRYLHYDPQTQFIADDMSGELTAHMVELNRVLASDKEYALYVSRYCRKLLPTYLDQFSRSGWMARLMGTGWIKGIAEGVLGRGLMKKHHALNNIQCESHRWAILRAMKEKYGIGTE